MVARRGQRPTEVGELQLQALEALGRLGRGTVYQVLEQFPEEVRPRYTTMLTVLRSLERRGLVAHDTADRAYVFRPLVEPRRVRGQMVRDLLERVFRGNPRELVACLLQYGSVSRDELAELRALLSAKEGESDDRLGPAAAAGGCERPGDGGLGG
jgi:BlaI family transcriptional regulator, penicillinase repressor